jgi:small conductance mechanosensitive channel
MAFSIWRGRDPWGWILETFSQITAERWSELGFGCAKLLAAGIGLVIILRIFRTILRKIAILCISWENLRDNDKSLERFFIGLERAIGITAWLIFIIVSWHLLSGSAIIGEGLEKLTVIYVVVSVGILIIRAMAVVIDTFEGLSQRYAQNRGWLIYYEHLKPLIPLLRRCLEYALWIGIASLVIAQLPKVSSLAIYGPRFMQVIGIFFLGRVGIEIGNLFIGRGADAAENVDDMTRRRRPTLIPLTRSLFRVFCYFIMFVLILIALDHNPMPFLAGAGVLGMVVGFGAQSLVNDVVSGFFILFENVYLVGDVIEGGGAKGTVEAIEFRTTRVRDNEGRLHIIRNGDMKQVVNFSREFTKAVVPFEVGYHADIQQVFAVLRACGEQLQQTNEDILDALQIDGITGFGGMTMTVRTSIRVKPGRHEAVAAALRLSLKEAFDRAAVVGVPRKGLVPAAVDQAGNPPSGGPDNPAQTGI